MSNYRRFAVLGACGIAGVALAFASTRGEHQRLSQDVVIPFELAEHHILVPVSVNGSKPLSFIFDTGANDAIIDAARARELKLQTGREIPLVGAGSGSLRAFFVSDAQFSLPALAGFSQPIAIAVPLDRLPPRLGHDVDGIIGTAFIKQFVVEVDYQRRVLVLHDAGTFAYSGTGTALPIRFDTQQHPLIDAAIEFRGEKYTGAFRLDLGASSALMLHSPFVAAHGTPAAGMPVVGTGGATGDSQGVAGRVSSLSLATYVLSRPPTLFSSDSTGALARGDLIGTIGARVTERFRVFLDYGRNRVILEPATAVDAPFPLSTCGCSILAEGPGFHTFRVQAVIDGWPAASAGLRIDDVITAVDGHPAADMTLTDLDARMEASTALHLTVHRGTTQLQIMLEPRPLP